MQHRLPADIERSSLAIIRRELEEKRIALPAETEAVVCRVIHATADFDYAQSLRFTPQAVEKGALPCPRQQDCPTLPLWRNLNALVQDYFSSVTLRDLAGNVQESADSEAAALSASADRTST